MKTVEYQNLLSERGALHRLIEATTEDQVITRGSLAARLKMVESRLAEAQVDQREPSTMKLTFRGKPVIGTEGIFAAFGAAALGCFNELVVRLAASKIGPLGERGPIPNRENNQLLLTATAQGSFGFELSEYSTDPLPAEDDCPTPGALKQAHALLKGVAGTDDELADAVGEVEPRAVDQLRAFLQTMVEAEAYCAANLNGAEVRFTGVEQITRGLERIRKENLPEQETVLEGRLLGALPIARTFEFERADDGKVIRGKVASDYTEVGKLNALLGKTVRIRVLETRVGKGQVRYRLLDVPQSGQA